MDQKQPTNPRRRRLLQALGATTLPALAAAPAQAAVTGNASVLSWAINSDPGIYAQAFAARFSNAFVNPLSTVAVGGVTAFYKVDQTGPVRFNIQAAQTQQDVLGLPGIPRRTPSDREPEW